jgi:autotransporter translocation and assembly factor TamB
LVLVEPHKNQFWLGQITKGGFCALHWSWTHAQSGDTQMSVSELKAGNVMEQKSAGDKQKALDAALAQIERAFGKGSVMKLTGESNQMQVEAISTGSLGLDIALVLAAFHGAVLLKFLARNHRVRQRWPCKFWPKHKKLAAHARSSMRNTRWIPVMPRNWALMSIIC